MGLGSWTMCKNDKFGGGFCRGRRLGAVPIWVTEDPGTEIGLCVGADSPLWVEEAEPMVAGWWRRVLHYILF